MVNVSPVNSIMAHVSASRSYLVIYTTYYSACRHLSIKQWRDGARDPLTASRICHIFIEVRKGESMKDKTAPIVGIVILALFIVFNLYMLINLSMSPDLWTRAAYLLGGVEAIAFAAAGYFFGREVNRQRAERAEAEADQAGQKTEQARSDAVEAEKRATEAETKGKTLKAAIAAESSAASEAAPGAFGPRPEGQAPATPGAIARLANLADQLFP
jgi:hypothetical protein